MNELVRLTTQDVGKGVPTTDSFTISKMLGDEHWKVRRLIDNNLDSFEVFGRVNFQSCTLDTEGGRQITEIAILTEEHFLFLITLFRVKTIKDPITEKQIKMQERNKRVIKLKQDLVTAFSFMKKELLARIETRHVGIATRKVLTSVIKKCVTDEGNFKKFAYGNYTKMVYKKIIGKDVKTIKEERNIKENESVRNYFTIEELEKIQDLESKIATFIEFTDTNLKSDKEIYAMVKEYLESSKQVI